MELLGGNTHLTAQTELSAVGKAGGNVPVYGGAVHTAGKGGSGGSPRALLRRVLLKNTSARPTGALLQQNAGFFGK